MKSSILSLEVAAILGQENTTFNLNPPAAPHFGGIWKACVKSTKYNLKRVIGDTFMTFSDMSTLLCRMKACLNSSPLLPLTEDP